MTALPSPSRCTRRPSPSAALHADRAQAYIKAAAADLARAAELDPAMSRAHACVELGQYGAALVPGDARFAELMKEIDDKAPKPMIPEPVMAMEAGKPRYRHDYYNSAAEVAVTVFAKGVAPEHVSVEFGEQTLSVSVEGAYQLQPRLFGKIIPDKCRFTVLQTKIEVRLAKAEPGTTWTSLECTGKPRLIAKKANGYSAGAQRPSYPSSSRGGKDWDKIVAEVKEEEKLDGDAAANRFFRDIFGQADEDARRAMTKSWVESNGTVLSTNWKEVGAKTIEPSAPKRHGGGPQVGVLIKPSPADSCVHHAFCLRF
jgi:suppressor of G2 allele of SKP1